MARHKSRDYVDERQRALVRLFITAGNLKLFNIIKFDAMDLWRLLRCIAEQEP